MTLEQELITYKNMVKLYKFDYLTGLKQRHDFEVETEHKLKNQSFYLAMFDIIGLHDVNRNNGYIAGDSLIKQVANAIQHLDGLWEIYRIGGDEFIALFFTEPDVSKVPNATNAVIHSSNYKSLNYMLDELDQRIIHKKASLNRRRCDL